MKRTKFEIIGKIVTLPRHYTYGGELFRVFEHSQHGYTLEPVFLDFDTLEYFDEEELIILNISDKNIVIKKS